ncbi:MAG: flippase-like domain-containing protein [Anaerolineae bacterium]|nr:flippase-like domain-containing protein [Anaerolineae bacterium]
MKKYRRLLILLILSALTIFGLLRLGQIDLSPETLSQVNWAWLPVVYLIFYSSVMARGLRWKLILKTMGWPLNYIYVQALHTSGLFISMILPARLGDVGRVVMLKQDHQIPITQSIASIATERALDVFSILVLAIIGALLALPGKIPTEISTLIIGTAILFIIGLIGLLVVPGFEGWLRRPGQIEKIISPLIWSLYQKALNFGFALIHGVRALGKSPAALALAVLQSLYIWFCDSLLIYFVLISLGAVSRLSVCLFVGMVSDLAAAVPITPGALGQFDAVVIGLLTLFGLTVAQGSLTVLLLRFVSLWTFLPVGAIVTYIFGFSRALNLNGQAPAPNKEPTTQSLAELAES